MKDFIGGENRETYCEKENSLLGTSFPKNVSVGPPLWALLSSLVSILLAFVF